MTSMTSRRIGARGPLVSPIGFGAFKIGRNEGIKYERGYDLPSERAAIDLVRAVCESGVTLLDTAPAYGLSEERVGLAIAGLRSPVVLSTKVGETFEAGRSHFDFSLAGIESSIARSLGRLGVARIDLLFLHSDGNDLAILDDGEATRVMRKLRERGTIGLMGFSGKSVEGHRQAIREGFDVLMVEYHPLDVSQRPALEEAAARGVGVLVKKPLAAGRLAPADAIPFALAAPAVASAVIGSLSAANIAECVRVASTNC
ncbi:MAG: aldo/keto reductase [Phycisphaerae bacterium]|jgi:aryl-alcohol dehydrogenase-like predicted oxidoreductase|nr:aldo/keto reductase [Phycisphaerae bacterium]